MKKFLLFLFIIIFLTSFNITEKLNGVLIGDSNVGVIKRTRGFNNIVNLSLGPYKGGISTQGLIDKLKTSKRDNRYNIVFVAIGTNDGYRTDFSKSLMKQIKRTYPNVRDVYVIWGSRGWGGVRHKEISHQETFYKKFEDNGFKVIKVTSGYFPSDALAHSSNQKYQIEIIEEIKIKLSH